MPLIPLTVATFIVVALCLFAYFLCVLYYKDIPARRKIGQEPLMYLLLHMIFLVLCGLCAHLGYGWFTMPAGDPSIKSEADRLLRDIHTHQQKATARELHVANYTTKNSMKSRR